MNIIGVCRILNEDDIVEAVIRHHLKHFDRVILLDDGSQDDTIFIIRSLIDENLPITLIEKPCLVSDERGRNTFLYHTACEQFSADWVVFFDADEFLDMRGRQEGLRPFLQSVPPKFGTIMLPMMNYLDSYTDDLDQIIVPERMVWRTGKDIGVYKVIVRGGLGRGVHIHEGNHTAYLNGSELIYFGGSNLFIAHFPRRSGWQDIYKWIIMRMKIIAAGDRETSKGTGSHYIRPLDILRDNPAQILDDKGFFHRSPTQDMVNDPMRYDGGLLKYTKLVNYRDKCVSLVISHALNLSAEFGRLMDSDEELRDRILGSLER
jgi:glycosyltransferase involved in cell wall biosynthesis